jgi:hypothetical protein
VRICNFSKSEGVHEQKSLGNIDLVAADHLVVVV